MGMGFAPTWLRQVSPPASHDHFNHCETDLVTNYPEWSTATQSGSGDSATACAEQNSLADTRGNGYVADKLQMMMMMVVGVVTTTRLRHSTPVRFCCATIILYVTETPVLGCYTATQIN